MINNKKIIPEKIKTAIRLLKEYVKDPEIDPILSILDSLMKDPMNTGTLAQLPVAFNELGIIRGAVLTYAPYVTILLSDEPFDERE